MVEVGGVRAAPAAAAAARPGRTSSGFAVSQGPAAQAAATEPPSALDGMLTLQEADGPPDPQVRDRQARRHGRALLDALRDLQLGLLDGAAGEGAANRLAALAELSFDAADPALRAVLAAVAVRAQVELARYGL